MDVTKELVCINFSLGTTESIEAKRNIIIGTQCCSFITESLNFMKATLLEVGLSYS